MGIISKAQYKEFYPDTTLSDAQLGLYIQVATDWVHKYLGQSLEKREVNERLEGSNSPKIYLKLRPIITVMNVARNGLALAVEDFIIADGQSFIIYPEKFYKGDAPDASDGVVGRYKRGDNLEVKYIGGYEYPVEDPASDGTVPYDLRLAVATLIQSLEQKGKKDAESGIGISDLTSYKIADIAYTFKSEAEKNSSIEYILDGYVVP